MPWTREQAAEAGRKGGQAKAVKAEERAQRRLRAAVPDLANELLDAAMARGKWSGENALPPDKRLTAVIRALEFGLGRPLPQSRPKEKGPEPTTPDNLFVE